MTRSKYTPAQRLMALIGVVALALLSISALVAALFVEPALAMRLLMLAVFVPIVLWLVLWAIGKRPGDGE